MTCCAPVEVVSCREEDSQPEFSTMWWWGTVPGCQVNAISLSEALSPGFLLLPWPQLLGCCTSGNSSSCLWRARLPRTGFLNYFPAFLKIGQLYQLDQRHLNWFWWSWVVNISLLRSSDTTGPLRPCRDSDYDFMLLMEHLGTWITLRVELGPWFHLSGWAAQKKEADGRWGKGLCIKGRRKSSFFFRSGFHLLCVWAVPHPPEGLEPSHSACSVFFSWKQSMLSDSSLSSYGKKAVLWDQQLPFPSTVCSLNAGFS